MIDERAYRTKDGLKANGWQRHDFDEWVDICRSAARLGGHSASELALIFSELQLEIEKFQADLMVKKDEIRQAYDEIQAADDALDEMHWTLAGAEHQVNIHKEELEQTQKGMRTLERRLERERQEFAAYRAYVQAAVSATATEVVAGSSSG